MPACTFVLIKQGIANLLHLLLHLLSHWTGFCLLIFLLRLDLLCDSQVFLSAYFLRHSRCLVAHKGSIIDLSVQTNAVGNDMDVHIVGVLVRYRYQLVVVKSHSLGK